MTRNSIPVKERILSTASKLFYEKGYNRTGINEILKESKVAKASMYEHFGSKDAIFLQCLQRMDEGLQNRVKPFIQKAKPGIDKVLSVFEFLESFCPEENFRGCWCLNTISEIPQDKTEILSEIRVQKARFRELIRKTVKENLPEVNECKVANQIYLLYEAAIIEAQIENDLWPVFSAKDTAKSLLS
ncbi:MAG: TetR/AcrR family transcriptional regulator [Bacteroidota bacterium]